MRDRWGRAAVLVVIAAVAATICLLIAVYGKHRLTDAYVYIGGGGAWAGGGDLYGSEYPTAFEGFSLRFTYPPLAAVLFAVLGLMPLVVAVSVFTAVSLFGLWVITHLSVVNTGFAAHLGRWFARAGDSPVSVAALAVPTAVVAVAAIALEPVRETLSFGQINLMLIALVAADCLVKRPPWPRGLLIGIAAAVKLTPAAFVLFFIARGQWRPMVTAVAGFVGCGLLGLVLAPSASRTYWLDALGDTSRVGNLAFSGNQSMRGVLARFGVPDSVAGPVWLVLCSLVVLVAWLVLRGPLLRRDDLGSFTVVATATLLISPVSWTHHWIAVLPGLLWGADHLRRRFTSGGAACWLAALAVFVVGPHWYLPELRDPGAQWNPLENLIGNAYVWSGLALLAALAVHSSRPDRTRAEAAAGVG